MVHSLHWQTFLNRVIERAGPREDALMQPERDLTQSKSEQDEEARGDI